MFRSLYRPALLEDNCFKIVYWPYIFLGELYWLNAALLNQRPSLSFSAIGGKLLHWYHRLGDLPMCIQAICPIQYILCPITHFIQNLFIYTMFDHLKVYARFLVVETSIQSVISLCTHTYQTFMQSHLLYLIC